MMCNRPMLSVLSGRLYDFTFFLLPYRALTTARDSLTWLTDVTHRHDSLTWLTDVTHWRDSLTQYPLLYSVHRLIFDKERRFGSQFCFRLQAKSSTLVDHWTEVAQHSRGFPCLKTEALLNYNSKIQIYKTIIRPAVTCGCETWVLTASDKNQLYIFERKILRKIYGSTQNPDGTWRIETNEELRHRMKQEDIIKFIKSQSLRWAADVMRM